MAIVLVIKRKKKKKSVDTRIPPTRCPYCNYYMDATTDAYGDHKPKKGDVSMCLRCGKLATFNEDLTIRKPTPEELETFIKDPLVTQAQIARAHVVGDKLDNR